MTISHSPLFCAEEILITKNNKVSFSNMSNITKHTTIFTIILAMTCLGNSSFAAPILINLEDNFFADPTVEFQDDGFTAVLNEDINLFSVLLSNDPGLGDPNVVDPGLNTILSFDYDFNEGAGNDDAFNAFVLDGTTGFSFGADFEFFAESTSNGVVSFDLSSLTDEFIGLQFQLDSFDAALDSTVTISNVRLEAIPEMAPIPEPSTICLFLLSSLLLPLVKRRFSLNK